MPRTETADYAAVVANKIISRIIGWFWCGTNADSTRMATTATEVLQYAMDAIVSFGYGLDALK